MDWKTRSVAWENLTDKLRRPDRTQETAAQYAAMSRDQKGRVKDVGGFVGGALEGGRRTSGAVLSRALLTLDIDYGTPDT